MRSSDRVHDVIIVGSGPAGYTAAIYTARAGLDTLVVQGEVPGGALTAAGPVDNYPGIAPSVCGPALAAEMRDQAKRFGAELRAGDVDRFDLHGEVKTIAIRDERHHARALVLAMGSINRRLNVPGERDFLATDSAPAPNSTLRGSAVATSPSSAVATPPSKRRSILHRGPTA